MRELRTALLIVGLAAVALAWPSTVVAQDGRATLLEQARKEGKVVVYGTLEPDTFHVIARIYQQRYGIPVEYWRAGEVADRVLAEHRSGRVLADVVLANSPSMALLKTANVFQPYASPSYELLGNLGKDREGILSPYYRLVPFSILYNTRLVKPEDTPRALTDLLDPKWRGRVVIPDPTVSIAFASWLMELKSLLGGQWRPFLEGLSRQVGGTVVSVLPVAHALISGEYSVGISYIKYVYLFGREGAPLDYVRLNPVLAHGHQVALTKLAPHPSAGKLFVDLLTSRPGLIALAQAGEFVLVPGIYPPIRDADKLRIRIMQDLDAEGFRKAQAELAPIFARRR